MICFSSVLAAQEITRMPANFIPDDDVQVVPVDQEIWLDRVMVNDNRGILQEVKENMQDWNEQEEFITTWDLQGRGYQIVDVDQRKRYLLRNSLKYLDKRISGEIKNAEAGSTMEKIGEAQKALKPQTKVDVAPNIKLKFKARVLQGKAYMIVDNPYLPNTTTVRADGRVDVHAKKEIESIGVQTEIKYIVNSNSLRLNAEKKLSQLGVVTKIDYEVTSGRWIASIDKELAPNVTATISSKQKLSSFSKNDEQEAKVVYQLDF